MKKCLNPLVAIGVAAVIGCTDVDNSIVPPASEVSAAPEMESLESLVEEGDGEDPNQE